MKLSLAYHIPWRLLGQILSEAEYGELMGAERLGLLPEWAPPAEEQEVVDPFELYEQRKQLYG